MVTDAEGYQRICLKFLRPHKYLHAEVARTLIPFIGEVDGCCFWQTEAVAIVQISADLHLLPTVVLTLRKRFQGRMTAPEPTDYKAGKYTRDFFFMENTVSQDASGVGGKTLQDVQDMELAVLNEKLKEVQVPPFV
eukprot:TRINITY_DN49809_c0_g1_i1.p1 TRINITY_DN49809_c0_g1~~TRINITY_DN49809_c0_g1_i1.p1  ORF type:complete len:136 (+),score=16.86 TRINITY_DN49809_c0_g1_i1:428-835(+)